MLDADYVAVIFVAAIYRAEKDQHKRLTRMRVSEMSIKRISQRKKLTPHFLENLKGDLLEYGYEFTKLDTGGYGVLYVKTLEGAPTFQPEKYLPEDLERKKGKVLDEILADFSQATE